MVPDRLTTRRLRVAFVVPAHWDFSMGGAEYQAKLLMERLNNEHPVDIAYFAVRVGGSRDFPDHRVIAVGRNDGRRKYGHFWDFFALQSALKAFGPDVIYQRVSCAWAGIAGRFARLTGTPMVTHISSENDCRRAPPVWTGFRRPHTIVESRLAKSGIRAASVLVAQTEDQRRLLKQNFDRDSVLIRNFHAVPKPRPKTAGAFTIAWIANLKRLKRPELLLDFAEQLADLDELRFVMAGQPFPVVAQQSELEQRISRLANVTYLGPISQTEVNDLLDRSRLLVNTSEFEGFSNVFIQAWMRAVPVVTLGVNPDELLNGGPLGIACQSTQQAVEYIRSLVPDSGRLADMGSRARAFAVENFSMQNASRLAALITDLARAGDQQEG